MSIYGGCDREECGKHSENLLPAPVSQFDHRLTYWCKRCIDERKESKRTKKDRS